jgi:hypothetical protein
VRPSFASPANAFDRDVSDAVLQVGERSLYPALQRLLLKGWIRAEWGASENNRRARYYTLTPTGRTKPFQPRRDPPPEPILARAWRSRVLDERPRVQAEYGRFSGCRLSLLHVAMEVHGEIRFELPLTDDVPDAAQQLSHYRVRRHSALSGLPG